MSNKINKSKNRHIYIIQQIRGGGCVQNIDHIEDKKNNQSYFWWFVLRFKSVFNYIGELTKFVIGKVKKMGGDSEESWGTLIKQIGSAIKDIFIGSPQGQVVKAINPEDLEIDCISAIENDASRAAQRRIMKIYNSSFRLSLSK